jgi:hypothetical protein
MHIALLASFEACGSVRKASASLGVPAADFDHAAAELLDWDFIESSGESAKLTRRGRRCVDAWRDTGRTGFWSFPSGSNWILGNGSFLFRKPLVSLDDAGLNPETGACLSEEDAERLLEEHRSTALIVAGQLESRELYHRLLEVLEAGQEARDVFEEAFENVQSRRQLTLLRQQAEEALADFCGGRAASWAVNNGVRRALKHVINSSWWRICGHEEEAETVMRVLLARWLRDRTGVLREIAEDQPNLLTLAAEGCEYFQTMEGVKPLHRSCLQIRRCA